MKWDKTYETFGSVWLLVGTPTWQLSSLFLFFIIVIFPGSFPALPGPGLRDARRALSLCSGLPPASASWGSRRRGCRWSTEPDADRRADQHRLGGLGQPTTQVPLQAACLSGILPSPSESISWHSRAPCCFEPDTSGLDKPPEPTHSDSSPLGQEKSPHCWPACSRWNFILLMWKAVPCTPKTTHSHAPPFLSCNKTPRVGYSSTTAKIRSWVYHFKLGI